MSNLARILILVCTVQLMPYFSMADTPSQAIFSQVVSETQPEKIFFLVSDDTGHTYVQPGSLISVSEGKGGVSKTLILGTRVPLNKGVTQLSHRLLLIGPAGETQVSSLLTDKIEQETESNSGQTVEEKIILRKKHISELQQDISYAEQKLKRAQNDADSIANVGRIIDAEDNLAVVSADLARFEASQQSLKSDLNVIQNQPEPRNYQLREAELTGQLISLAAYARSSENSASGRQADSYRSYDEKMALIEANKGEQIDRLKEELARVRRRKEAISNH